MKNVSGLICVVVGGLLIFWGYKMSQALLAKLSNFVGGSPGGKPMLLYLGGAILLIVGLAHIAMKGK